MNWSERERVPRSVRRPATRELIGRTFSSLRHRNYRLYFGGQIVSMIGNWMQNADQQWLVVELNGSEALLGTEVAIGVAPLFFFAARGGILAERFPRRKILIVPQCLPIERARITVKLPADSVPVKIGLGDELELIGYRIDALPTGSQALQLTLWWRGVRPATEDWTAFFHITPSANNAELVGQLDHAITDHEYPPTVWAAGEVVQEEVHISAAKLQPGSYAVWMGLYAPVTQMRAAIKAGPGVVVDNRALLLEFQLAP